jgi:hypothetical protein
MSKYKTGNGPQQITLSVDIGTVGLAATRAAIDKKGNPLVPVANSLDVSGDILPSKQIGSANSIQGSDLFISTIIDLRIFGNINERKAESERIMQTYTLDGGSQGMYVDSTPDVRTVDPNFESVILVKYISLT